MEQTTFLLNTLVSAWIFKLIIARLAGDDKFDQIYTFISVKLLEAIKQGGENAKEYQQYMFVIERLHDKLKNVAPLTELSLIGDSKIA